VFGEADVGLVEPQQVEQAIAVRVCPRLHAIDLLVPLPLERLGEAEIFPLLAGLQCAHLQQFGLGVDLGLELLAGAFGLLAEQREQPRREVPLCQLRGPRHEIPSQVDRGETRRERHTSCGRPGGRTRR